MRNQFVSIILATLLVGLSALPSTGAEYYLAPNGRDSGSGTITDPWQSLEKAGSSMAAGDVLYCRGGEYTRPDDYFRPLANNITLRNYSNEVPVFRTMGNVGFWGLTTIVWCNMDELTIEGLEFRPLGPGICEMGFFLSGDRAVLRRVVVVAPKINGRYIFNQQILRIQGDYVEVDRCHLSGVGDTTVPTAPSGNVLFGLGNYLYIHDNHFERGAHDVVRLDGQFSVVRNNNITHAIGYGVLLQGGSTYCLVEFNRITGCDEEIDYVKTPIYFNGGNRAVVRYNVAWGNEIYGYTQRGGSGNRIYNNVFYGNGSAGFHGWCSEGATCQDNKHINNVIAKNMRTQALCVSSYAEVFLATDVLDPTQGNQFQGNYIMVFDNDWEYDHSCAVSRREGTGYISSSVSWFEATYSTWFDNIYNYCDPAFVNPDAGDFRIQEGSCLKDTGVALTTARVDGSGTALPVIDALFFWVGDEIQVSTTASRKVVAIDYTNNVLTLDLAASWSAGDDVTLAYAGAAPDIGAFELGRSTAVTVEAFAATGSHEGIRLEWQLSEEALNELAGVHVQRSDLAAGAYTNRTAELLGPALAMSYFDTEAVPEREYWYRLLLLDHSGTATVGPTVSASTDLTNLDPSLDVAMRSAESAEIRFAIGSASSVDLRVYTVAGRLVRQLDRGDRPAGRYVLTWDTRDQSGRALARGIYLVELRAGPVRVSRKLLLVRG